MPQNPAAQKILELLERVIPAPRRGTRLLDGALRLAGLDALPETTDELKLFVHRDLRRMVEEELGQRLAHEIINDLDASLTPALRRMDTMPAAPSSRRMRQVSARPEELKVLIVGGDRLRNASLARVLIREGYSVATARDHAEIAIATASAPIDVVVLDPRCAGLGELLGATRTLPLRDGQSPREVLNALAAMTS